MQTVPFDAIIGNVALRTRLGSDLLEGKLSHAYILEGASGSGKRTLARELSAALACTERRDDPSPCGHCIACRKVYENQCPDIIRIARGNKAGIGVDDVRFLRSDVLIEPNDLSTKIYIIEDADTMTVQAQNALLLTLEEPPPYVLFLLLCERSAKLLETIRSRAPTLRMCPVPKDEVRAYLMRTVSDFARLSAQEQDEILMIADGSLGRARELSDAKARRPLIERRKTAMELVSAILGRQNSAQSMLLLQGLGTKREEIVPLLSDVAMALRDLILLKRTEDAPLCFYAVNGQALLLSDQTSMQRLLRAYDLVERSRARLTRNANVRLLLTELLLARE